MTLAITNALILAGWDVEPRPGAVLIEGDRIAGVAHGEDAAALATQARERFDAGGAILMPGFVNAHHHSYANVLRGTENSLPLERWALHTIAWGHAIDADMLRLAILLGAAEMLRAGVASVIDHSPQVGFHARAFAAHVESGMRVGYAPMLHDLHDHDLLGEKLTPAERAQREGAGFPPHDFYRAMIADLVAASRGEPRLRILLGPNAPQRCSAALLDLWRSLRDAHALHVHTHLLETRAQAELCTRRYEGGVVAELVRRGLLDSGLAVAHGVWTTAAEQDALARHGVTVVHNPASNLMLGSGVMPYAGYAARGVPIALGSDSANSGGGADPFALMRLALMLPRPGGVFPTPSDALRLATENGANALGLAGALGRLSPGALADLVVLDLTDTTTAAMSPTRAVLVQHATPAHVRATMVGGRWAYRDGRVLAFDEPAVLATFRARAATLATAGAEATRVLHD